MPKSDQKLSMCKIPNINYEIKMFERCITYHSVGRKVSARSHIPAVYLLAEHVPNEDGIGQP